MPEGKEADLDGGERIADFVGDCAGHAPEGRELLLPFDDGSALGEVGAEGGNHAAVRERDKGGPGDEEANESDEKKSLQAGEPGIGMEEKLAGLLFLAGEDATDKLLVLFAEVADLVPGEAFGPNEGADHNHDGHDHLAEPVASFFIHTFPANPGVPARAMRWWRQPAARE